MILLSGSSHTQLATEVAQKLGLAQVETESSVFANGERRVWIKENLRGQDVAILQSFSNPVDQNIMEFLLMVDAVERLGANSVLAVIPWLGYSFQDKVFRPGEPIAAKVIADLISNSFVHRVFLMDLHNPSIPGFFSVPTIHLSADQLMADYIQQNLDLKNTVVTSPDFGGIKRSREFAQELGLELFNINKHRDKVTGEVTAVSLRGSVKGKQVILFDDSVLSGQTVIETAKLLKKEGAKSIYFLATHGLFTGDALENISRSHVNQVIVTNTINHKNLPKNVVELSVAPIIEEALKYWK